MTKTKYTIYRNNERVSLPSLTAKEIHQRVRNLPCGGRVWDLIEAGYTLHVKKTI